MGEHAEGLIPLIVLAGLTATGKSELAVGIAQEFDGEVISADSMQIYKGLDVGTSKLSKEAMRGIAHHMIDIVEPDVYYDVAQYVREAKRCINEIIKRGRLPIVCGGTGLYISSLLNRTPLDYPKTDKALRKAIEEEYDRDNGLSLGMELADKNNEALNTVHKNDKKRIVRSIELQRLRDKSLIPLTSINKCTKTEYKTIEMILIPNDRISVYSRVAERVDIMMDNGLLSEAEYVYTNRSRFNTASQAIAYKEFFDYFEQKAFLGDCVNLLKQSTRRYAKRQATWFNRYEKAVFLNPDTLNFREVKDLVKNRLKD